MTRTGFADRLRYAFDNSMSRGAIALIGYLGLVSVALIFFFALLVVLFHIAPAGGNQPGFSRRPGSASCARSTRAPWAATRAGRSASPCWE